MYTLLGVTVKCFAHCAEEIVHSLADAISKVLHENVDRHRQFAGNLLTLAIEQC
ncbi:hypothetical protein D3C76_1575170 [compost metagenome]